MDTVMTMEKGALKKEVENFGIGDTIKVHYRIIEGKTERIQIFEGVCLAKKNASIRKTFTVRKMSYGVGVERVFPLYSPKIERIEMVRRGKTRRAKLYYLRKRIGKAAKVTERIVKKTDEE